MFTRGFEYKSSQPGVLRNLVKNTKTKDSLNMKFEMKYLGRASRILRMNIKCDRKNDILGLSHDSFFFFLEHRSHES